VESIALAWAEQAVQVDRREEVFIAVFRVARRGGKLT
jgi:hypothetical protein